MSIKRLMDDLEGTPDPEVRSKALREEAELSRMIVDGASDFAIFTLDRERRVLTWNPGAEMLTGFAAVDIIGQSIDLLFTEEDRENGVPEAEALKAIQMGRAEDDRWHVRRDGGRIFASGLLMPLRDEAGEVRAFLKIFRDQTEREEVGQRLDVLARALEVSEARYRLLVSEVRDYAIYMIDPDGFVMTWNAGAERLKLYTEGEIIGQNFSRFFRGEDVLGGRPRRELDIAAAEGRYEEENWRVRKDGSFFWANEIATAIRDRDGTLRGYTKITRDLTDQKRIREALEESEARFRAVADLVPDLLWRRGPKGEGEWVNRRWADYTGQSSGQAAGFGWLDAIHPGDRERSRSSFRDAVEAGRPLRHEHRIRGVDGRYRWFLVQALPVLDEAGRILRWFGAATDVHEQRIALEALKATEGELRRARDELEARVAERTVELSMALDSLGREAAERERTELARLALLQRIVEVQEQERARISRELHDEMGQHIAALTLELKLLRDSFAESAASIERLKRLQERTARVGRELHRLAFELRPPALDDLGLEVAVQNYLEEWSERSGVGVAFHGDGFQDGRAPSQVETAIYRILQEALTNVVKHASATKLGVVLEKRANSIQLIVEDDGLGFDVDAVMDAPDARRRLGLVGMKERVAMVGGTLALESRSGGPTTIYARIPLHDDPGGEGDG